MKKSSSPRWRASPPNLLPPDLTVDEERVLPYLCSGWSNHQIGIELGVSDPVVEQAIDSCLKKFGATCRAKLATRLLEGKASR